MDSFGNGGRKAIDENNRYANNESTFIAEGQSDQIEETDLHEQNEQQRALHQRLVEQLNEQRLLRQQLLQLQAQNQNTDIQRRYLPLIEHQMTTTQPDQYDFSSYGSSNASFLSISPAILRQQQGLPGMQRQMQYNQSLMQQQAMIRSSIDQQQQRLQQQRLLNNMGQYEQYKQHQQPIPGINRDNMDITAIIGVGGGIDNPIRRPPQVATSDSSVARLPTFDTPNINPQTLNFPGHHVRDSLILEQLLQQKRLPTTRINVHRGADAMNSYSIERNSSSTTSTMDDFGLDSGNLTRIESRLKQPPNEPGFQLLTGQQESVANWKTDESVAQNIAAQSQEKKKTIPKRKGSSRKKLPGMPKRPLHAYNIFFQEERQKILSEIPSPTESEKQEELQALEGQPRSKQKRRVTHGKISFASLAKEIGYKWHTLEKEKKEQYQQAAEIDLQRYEDELDAYTRKMKKQKKQQQQQEGLHGDDSDTKFPAASKESNLKEEGTPTSDEYDDDQLSTTVVVAKKKKM